MRAAGFSSSQVRAIVESAVTSSKRSRSSTAGCDVLATCPAPVSDMIRAGQDRSECQASNAKTGAGGRPTIFGASTASIPPWLRRYKDTTCVRSTYCGASLQADAACRRPKFTELTATNLNILCNALQLRVPRHGNIIPGISCTVLRCRSGVTRTIPSSLSSTKATCLLFLGGDYGGKVAVAQELARLVFGSYAEFTTVQLQGSPNIRTHNGKLALKRQRSPDNDGDLEERLFEAVVENPHRVILMDGVHLQDRDLEMHIMGGGMVRGCNGDVVSLEDAIIVLSASDVLDSRRYVASPSSPRAKRRFGGQNREKGDDGTEMKRRHGCDLNVCPVVEEEEEDSLADDEGIQNVVDGVFLFN
ncbi:protein SMAX1-LIKE 3-like [Triticum dicoccoides]|uniref:protein SMAX1-LIKE 3-like n=1 Tax=Triticum dicoccoides TaxID=85692 RepID=UPI00188F71DF|nr:protein SMAX1-LIKE 3-like [Triticum dicoccoides]